MSTHNFKKKKNVVIILQSKNLSSGKNLGNVQNMAKRARAASFELAAASTQNGGFEILEFFFLSKKKRERHNDSSARSAVNRGKTRSLLRPTKAAAIRQTSAIS